MDVRICGETIKCDEQALCELMITLSSLHGRICQRIVDIDMDEATYLAGQLEPIKMAHDDIRRIHDEH